MWYDVKNGDIGRLPTLVIEKRLAALAMCLLGMAGQRLSLTFAKPSFLGIHMEIQSLGHTEYYFMIPLK